MNSGQSNSFPSGVHGPGWYEMWFPHSNAHQGVSAPARPARGASIRHLETESAHHGISLKRLQASEYEEKKQLSVELALCRISDFVLSLFKSH